LINNNKRGKMSKPKCKDCESDMNFYSSMMTFACLKCHNSIRGIVAWNEEEAIEKLNKMRKK